MSFVNSSLCMIGNTPLLKLENITKDHDVNVYAKCEHINPSGSIKDRMALRMIEEAEKKGKLKPGSTIVESSCGNTGPALAFVGGMKGYKVKIFIPSQWTGAYNASDRIKILKYFGAEAVPITVEGYEHVFNEVSEIEKALAVNWVGVKKCYDLDKKYEDIWWANQSCNPYNALANKESTGKEIIEQLNGKVDGWVASIGTGGTFLGVAEALKEVNPSIHLVGVDPVDMPILDLAKIIQDSKVPHALGLPDMKSLVMTMLEKDMPDEVVAVDDVAARNMANRLCREEGIFCGMSSGANVLTAIETAKKLGGDANVVTVIVDRRDRYFSEYPEAHYVI